MFNISELLNFGLIDYDPIMAEFVHPDPDDVPLSAALHALADPLRLEILHNLAAKGPLSCEGALPGDHIAKSTRSNHFRILREAGLIHTRKTGREYISTLRRAEIDRRFPGLLNSVLTALSEEP